jgi:tetratricopeptide (TPR) repeat protein
LPKPLLEAQLRTLLNQPQAARAQYEAARAILEARIRQDAQDSRYYSALGIALAGLGSKTEAIRAGRRGVELLPVSKEAYRGTYRREDLARIYAAVGDGEAAIDEIEYLLSIPGELGLGALQLDPAWNPLRGIERFERLVARARR